MIAKRAVHALSVAVLITGAVTACGGGGGPAAAPPAPSATTTPSQTGFSVGGSVTGLKSNRPILLSLSDQQLSVQEGGSFVFPGELEEGAEYEVLIVAEPPRFDCEISNNSGTIAEQDIDDIAIQCETNDSFDLFSLDRLHSIKLTMTVDEWRAFELDTIRANYSVKNADGGANPLTSFSHSEVYRQADFTYLDDDGTEIASMPKVGFKMQGNTSRQYPIDTSVEPNKPRRFGFSIKFDEEFDEDESVYSCIDYNGVPTAVEGFPCKGIVGQDVPDYPDADGREFMDVEKIRFRFNRDDPTYQREVLTHELLNDIGIPAARATHAKVELVVTGDSDQRLFDQPLPQSFNMGVFTMMEQIDKPFLKLFFDKNGYLFKVGAPGNLAEPDAKDESCSPYEESGLFYDESFCVIGREKSDPDSRLEWLGEDNYLNPEFVNSNINGEGPSGPLSQFLPYQPTYDLKTKKKSLSEARDALREFAKFVQSRPSAQALAERFDVPGFIKAQALEIVVGAVDHYVRVANNYYLYFNEDTGQWAYIPTDFDYTLIDTLGPNCEANPALEICNQFLNVEAFTDIASTTAFDVGSNNHWAGRFFYQNYPPILWEIVFSSDANRAALYEDMKMILDNYFSWDLIEPRLELRRNRVEAVVVSTDASNPEVLNGGTCPQQYNPDEIAGDSSSFCDKNRASIRDFIERRRSTLLQEYNSQ